VPSREGITTSTYLLTLTINFLFILRKIVVTIVLIFFPMETWTQPVTDQWRQLSVCVRLQLMWSLVDSVAHSWLLSTDEPPSLDQHQQPHPDQACYTCHRQPLTAACTVPVCNGRQTASDKCGRLSVDHVQDPTILQPTAYKSMSLENIKVQDIHIGKINTCYLLVFTCSATLCKFRQNRCK